MYLGRGGTLTVGAEGERERRGRERERLKQSRVVTVCKLTGRVILLSCQKLLFGYLSGGTGC